jgi:hypothetical protein
MTTERPFHSFMEAPMFKETYPYSTCSFSSSTRWERSAFAFSWRTRARPLPRVPTTRRRVPSQRGHRDTVGDSRVRPVRSGWQRTHLLPRPGDRGEGPAVFAIARAYRVKNCASRRLVTHEAAGRGFRPRPDQPLGPCPKIRKLTSVPVLRYPLDHGGLHGNHSTDDPRARR